MVDGCVVLGMWGFSAAFEAFGERKEGDGG